ncbi:MAG: PD40 domain-containing protein, partial [Ignavibacteriales bacterium]|nr:PD40 domain-containing protein [Ignavibacteriales bacterium]
MRLEHFRRQLKLAAFFLLLMCNCYSPYPVAPQNESAFLITDGQFPSISPNGTRLAFVRNGKILVANLDGTGEIEVAAGGVHGNCLPRWSPDGSRIGFIRSNDWYTGQLYAIDPNTKAEVLLSGSDTVSFDLNGSTG